MSSQGVRPARGGAFWVAAGIFLSRISGLARERAFAAYFGNSEAADAFKAALKIPNFLQNLFGEGVLSGSFIPAYAGLLARGQEDEARKLAGAIATWLALVVSVLAALGAAATPDLIDLIAPGFHGEKRALTIALVQIFFPGVALLTMSAWCLGILNSHRRFFLSYTAPVAWNLSIVAAIIFFGRGAGAQDLSALAMKAGWGLVVGSLLQLVVQMPATLSLLGRARPTFSRDAHTNGVFLAFGPMVLTRGVVQISAYVDNVLASWLPSGSVSALAYAQTIYVLPVSLFGMSVAAASLPDMAGSAFTGTGPMPEAGRAVLRAKLESGYAQIAYFIIPSTAAFLLLGDRIVGALFQTGAFSHGDALFVWSALAGSGVGLLAGTFGRLCSSTFYAIRDVKTPLRCAAVRVALTTILGYFAGLRLPGWIGVDAGWGIAGLTASAGIAGWVEFMMLRSRLRARIGPASLPRKRAAVLWLCALASAAIGWMCGFGFDRAYGFAHPILAAAASLGPFGAIYLASTWLFGVPHARAFGRRLLRS